MLVNTVSAFWRMEYFLQRSVVRPVDVHR
jgi:hypothetical protein